MKGNYFIQFIDLYDKKKENMNPILKYLFGTLIVKGDIP